MTEKKSTTMHGVLVHPLQIGACALIFYRGQLIRTSTVVAIHYDSAEVMQFETRSTRYTLLLDPTPQMAVNPAMPVLAVA